MAEYDKIGNKRTEQFNCRSTPAFKKVLDLLSKQKDGHYHGMTQADILHELVRDTGRKCLPNTAWYLEHVTEI